MFTVVGRPKLIPSPREILTHSVLLIPYMTQLLILILHKVVMIKVPYFSSFPGKRSFKKWKLHSLGAYVVIKEHETIHTILIN